MIKKHIYDNRGHMKILFNFIVKVLLFYLVIVFNIIFINPNNKFISNCRAENSVFNISSDDNVVLFNPGMGLTLFATTHYNDKQDKWFKDVINIAYMKFRWKDLEPEEGIYNFNIIHNWMKPWLAKGYRVAFGVKSTDLDGTATPYWVFKAGVPAVSHLNNKQIDPPYWHPIYLKKYANFVRMLGKSFDGFERLEYVDMRGIGVWGEMHLGLFIKGMWTKQELERYGYNDEEYKNAYKKMLNMYLDAFPNTQIFLNIDVPFDDLAEYAAKKGIGLRYDGLSLKGGKHMKGISRIFRDFGYNGRILPIGIKCHYEFAGEESSPQQLRDTLDLGLSDPVSYIFPNPGLLTTISDENKNIMKLSALKVGYRFVLNRISIDDNVIISRKGNIIINTGLEWINNGVAPCYKPYKLAYTLIDSTGKVVFEDKFSPGIATTVWAPSKKIILKHPLTLTDRILVGEYTLNIFMFDPLNKGVRIKLGIKGNDGQQRYKIAHVRITSGKDGNKIANFLKQ